MSFIYSFIIPDFIVPHNSRYQSKRITLIMVTTELMMLVPIDHYHSADDGSSGSDDHDEKISSSEVKVSKYYPIQVHWG